MKKIKFASLPLALATLTLSVLSLSTPLRLASAQDGNGAKLTYPATKRGDVVDNHHEPDQRVAGDEGPVEDGEIGVVKGRGHLAAQRYQADGGRA